MATKQSRRTTETTVTSTPNPAVVAAAIQQPETTTVAVQRRTLRGQGQVMPQPVIPTTTPTPALISDITAENRTSRRIVDKSKTFEQAALEVFPYLEQKNTISRKEVNAIVYQTNVSWPRDIVNKENQASRGVYWFNPHPELTAPLIPPAPILHKEEQPVATVTAQPLPVYVREVSDTQLEAFVKERYSAMDSLIDAVAHNAIHSLIISGAPGLGKSHDTNLILSRINKGYVFHRGYLRASHLYRLLWENRNRGQVIVIDDCDIWNDLAALNILKAALELKDVRQISWGSEKEFIDTTGNTVPRQFNYEGSVIFLTNENLADLRNTRAAQHIDALESRSLMLDLKITTPREILTKIKLTLKAGMLRSRGISATSEQEILAFMEANAPQFKELSLRTVEKIAVLYLTNPTGWQQLARTVCLK